MSRETDFGDFNLFPKCLKLWIFSRFNRVVLAKLRVNKSLKEFIDDKVNPHIEVKVEEIIKHTKYEIKYNIYCKCSDESVKGCVKNSFKIIENDPSLGNSDKTISDNNGIYMYNFSIYPEEYQPSGTVNWSKIDNLDFKKPGICFTCIMVNGIPK